MLFKMFISLLFCSFSLSLSANELIINSKSTIQFATLSEGQSILATKDAFIKAMTPVDFSLRIQTDKNVSEKDYLAFLKKHVLVWQQNEMDQLKVIINTFKNNLLKLKVKLPRRIYLIKTTGDEEGQALYTRSNAIIIPRNIFSRYSQSMLKHILAHELFHVISRRNPKIRPMLYRLIGFDKINEIEFPDEIKSRKITNPDAPFNNYKIKVYHQKQSVDVIPVLYSKEKNYNTKKKGNLFNYMIFHFLVIENLDGKWQPKYVNDKALFLELNQITGYYEQIGQNTTYIIHPEEIIAENFALLITEKENLPSPVIIEKMKMLLFD